MSPLDALLWVLVALGSVIVLTILAFVIVLLWGGALSLRRMSAEDEGREIYRGRADR